MIKQKINLPTVTNPNPTSGKTSVITVPGGYRVHQILLSITADTGTNLPIGNWIGDIRVKLGGKVQRLHSASELNLINKTNGTVYGAVTLGSSASNYGQQIPIYFAEPWRNDNTQGEFLAWNSTPSRLIEVEVDCNGTPTGTTPTITVSAVAIVDGSLQAGSDKTGGLITKIFRSDFASAANLDITTLDRRDIYQAIYITAANISKAVLKANGITFHELTKATNAAYLTQTGMAAQFDYDMVLDADDPLQSGLNANGLSDLQLRIEQSSAAAIRVLSQRLGSPE
jgi:hypothetical protein